jgi:hypothetical protein
LPNGRGGERKVTKALAAVAVGGLLFAATVRGEEPLASDGNDLLRRCTFALKSVEPGIEMSKENYAEGTWCIGFAYGVMGVGAANDNLCIPNRAYRLGRLFGSWSRS